MLMINAENVLFIHEFSLPHKYTHNPHMHANTSQILSANILLVVLVHTKFMILHFPKIQKSNFSNKCCGRHIWMIIMNHCVVETLDGFV